MNLEVYSDCATTVTASFWFAKEQKWWKKKLRLNDEVTSECNAKGIVFHVVGRACHELGFVQLEWDDRKIEVFPNEDGSYGPVIIHQNGRDYWTNALRQKALEAEKHGYN